MSTSLFFIIVGILSLGFLSYHIIFYYKTKVPIIISPKKHIESLKKYLVDNTFIDSNSVVYELGSGWGNFSFTAEIFSPKKIVGYELSPVHIWYSNLKANYKKSKAIFVRKDFFEADISDANFIYVFLMPKVVNRLWQKIKQECSSGTVMVLLGHEIEGETYFKKIKTNPDKEDSTYYYFYKV